MDVSILRTYANGKANIIHYASKSCKLVTHSVMAAEVHALVLAFDYAYVISDMAQQILGGRLDIEVDMDSRTMFNVVVKNGTTMDRCLQMIDKLTLHDAYSKGDVRKITWTTRTRNPADAFTENGVDMDSRLCNLLATELFVPNRLGGAVIAREKKKT